LILIDKLDTSKLLLTRSDDGYVEVPIIRKTTDSTIRHNSFFTRYLVKPEDKVTIQVRSEPVVDKETSRDDTFVFNGIIKVIKGIPVWYISKEQSTIPVGTYYWDAQIELKNGLRCTYNSGKLEIMSEGTL